MPSYFGGRSDILLTGRTSHYALIDGTIARSRSSLTRLSIPAAPRAICALLLGDLRLSFQLLVPPSAVVTGSYRAGVIICASNHDDARSTSQFRTLPMHLPSITEGSVPREMAIYVEAAHSTALNCSFPKICPLTSHGHHVGRPREIPSTSNRRSGL
jgi:hypothetical protein